MQTEIKSYIETILERKIVLEKPKDISLGHFATPVAFSLAKELRQNPVDIAEELSKKFSETDFFEEVRAVKGFLNFKLSKEYLNKVIDQCLLLKDDFAKPKIARKEKILLEFVSANPTGPLHIGHARGAIFGDALLKVGRYLGYDITSEYYVNDAGAQMELLFLSLKLAADEYIFKKETMYPEQFYRGEYLIEIAEDIIKVYGQDIFDDVSKYDEVVEFAKKAVIKIITRDLKDLGVVFDRFVSEKSLYKDWEVTKNILEKNGHLYSKDNKVFLASMKYGDDSDRVVVRDNGVPTYLAGDIIYHKDKFERKFDKYINIWGADHHGYIKRVKAAVQFLGYDEKSLEILLSQMVALLQNGEPYKMSKRAGTVILMSDITELIGSDALRFIFLTKKADTHLEFDLEILKNNDSSNPIFYINYAHARIHQLFAKSIYTSDEIYQTVLKSNNQDGLDLIFESLLLQSVLEEAFAKREMQKITEYLSSLASSIHRFYNEYKIVGNEYEKEYLKILSLASLSLRVGLKVLGIQAKDKM